MERVLIFGTGKGAANFYRFIGDNTFDIIGFLDNDKNKCGRKFYKYDIFSTDELTNLNFDKIIICSYAYYEIKRQLLTDFNIPSAKIENYFYCNKLKFLEYYDGLKNLNSEQKEIIDYLNNNELSVFNYSFSEKYNDLNIEVQYDHNNHMFYQNYKGKKMYLKKSLDTYQKAIDYFRSILKEQDENSPHRYLTNDFDILENSIVMDAGVAEGNFSLDIIDRVKKIYLVEVEPEWVEALEITFSKYKEKVVIIQKFLSDKSDEKNITIDEIIGTEKLDFIKMDIEGAELEAIKGGCNTLMNNNIRLSICAYHNEEDEKNIINECLPLGFEFEIPKGYMVFLTSLNWNNSIEPKKMVRGVLRGKKRI